MDSFLQNHQASLDRQREEAEIEWLFPEEDEVTESHELKMDEVEPEDLDYFDWS